PSLLVTKPRPGGQPLESLSSELVSFIVLLRPLFRAEVFASFCYLIVGILIGEAKAGTVRASVFAGAGYWPQRLSALFCRHKLSHIVAPGLKLKLRYLLTTERELAPQEAVRTYDGQYQIEVNIDEVKELGLAHYQGRSGQGIRRWPLFLSLGQMILKFIATGVLTVRLPRLHWAWYTCENTVGRVPRPLLEACHPHISRTKVDGGIQQKWAKAA